MLFLFILQFHDFDEIKGEYFNMNTQNHSELLSSSCWISS